MRIINADSFDVILNNSIYITDINMKSDKIFDIVTKIKLSKEQEIELLRLLNNINNQGIEAVNTLEYNYIIKGKKLLLSSMSTSEALFTLAYLTDIEQVERYFYKDIKELSKETKRLFFKYFKDSKYINIIAEDSLVVHNYNKYLSEVV